MLPLCCPMATNQWASPSMSGPRLPQVCSGTSRPAFCFRLSSSCPFKLPEAGIVAQKPSLRVFYPLPAACGQQQALSELERGIGSSPMLALHQACRAAAGSAASGVRACSARPPAYVLLRPISRTPPLQARPPPESESRAPPRSRTKRRGFLCALRRGGKPLPPSPHGGGTPRRRTAPHLW